jgi:putative ABC transport system permease protein
MGVFSSLTQDIHHAGRRLRSEPGFALVAIVTMALGIAVSAAMFSVLDGVLLRPLPWPEADRIVRIEERRGGVRGRTPWTVTNGTYNAWRDSTATLEGLGGWMSTSQIVRGSGDPERLVVAAATPSLFAVLRARPEVGRLFLEGDADFGEVGRAILAFGLWQERFAGDRAVIGRTISLDDRTYEIVGVMPREFAFPDREARVWVPFRPLPLMSRDGRQMRVVVMSALARLAPGVTPAQAAAEGTARVRTVPDIRQAALSVFGSKGELSVAVAPALDVLTGEVRPVLGLVVFAVVLLLAAATANVVSVQLARATTRRRETAIRTAVGAGFWRLIQLWLVESALLGLCAGIAGVAIAGALCRLLPAWLPADFPRLDGITLDARSVLFSMAVTALVSIVCGTVPMLMTWQVQLASVLGDSASAVGLAMRTPISRLRTLIMIGQVAIACVLLVGGTLLARSFMRMVEADRGYEPSNLLTARLTFPHLEQDQRRVQILETLQERLRAIPEVSDAAFGNGLPLVNAGNVFGRIIPSPRDPSTKLQIGSTWRVVSPEYGTALQLHMVAGRPLASTDTASSPGVIVVNRSFVREYLGSDPVGQRLQLGLSSQLDWQVVGVVDDVRQGHVTEPARPEFFVSYRQVPDGIAFDPMVLLRTRGDPTPLIAAMRDVIRRVDPVVVLDSVMTMEDRVMASLGRPRAYALVLGGLAALALVIAGVGLFGVLSYTTVQRRPEIGIRVALGAASRDIVRLVVGQGAMLIGAGLVVGLTLTLLSAGLLSKFVYGINARDAISFTVAPIVIAGVGIIACVVPARRAIRTDPAEALRVN